ncbi:MAG TPA: DUF1365 domain-containing protein [Opitutaceae bacterium]|nr:DUF1365 domain-containing protein [Opitutaceae bacterium]
MRSGLYECSVMHHRFAPKAHRFAYRIFMLAVDLDELGSISKGNPLLSVNSRNLYSFRESDYFPTAEKLHNGETPGTKGGTGSLKFRVTGYLAERGVEIPGGRVVLVSLPRVAGYLFNPVSFYFCYDADGRPAAAIAEVTNTFREMKAYFLGTGSVSPRTGEAMFECRIPKFFYVSPFSDVDVAFDFHLHDLGESLSIRIDDYQGEERTLTSMLSGRRSPLTAGRLAWCSVKYPLITLRIIALIHIHALILHLKRVPWFAKAARPADQRSLYRPHESIATTSAS